MTSTKICAQSLLCCDEGSILLSAARTRKNKDAQAAVAPSTGADDRRTTADVGSHLNMITFPSLALFDQDLAPYSTIVILESMMPTQQYNVQCVPVGLLCIEDNAVGHRILDTGFFSDQMVQARTVRVKWFSATQILLIVDDVNRNNTTSIVQSVVFCEVLRLVVALEVTTPVNYAFCDVETPHNHSLFLRSLLATWIGLFEEELEKQISDPSSMLELGERPLSYAERMCVFLHASLRFNKSTDVDTKVRAHILCFSRTSHQDKTLSADIDSETETSMDMVNSTFKRTKDYLVDMIDNYALLVSNFKENILYTSEHLARAMNAKRSTYSAFPLYVSLKLDKFVTKQTSSIPVNCADVDSVRKWTNDMSSELDELLNDRVVYDESIADVKPIYLKYDSSGDPILSLLRLYGNYAPFADSIRQVAGWPVPRVSFKLKRCATLTYEDGGIQQIFKHSHHFFTPIFWSSQEKSFIRMVAVEDKAPLTSQDQEDTPENHAELAAKRTRIAVAHKKRVERSVEELMNKKIDLEYVDMYANEYITDALHFSSFVADVDLYCCSELSVRDTAEDTCHLVSTTMTKAVGRGPLKITVFSSGKQPVAMGASLFKIGLHVHAKLPLGFALTSQACRQLVAMMEMLRFNYPTLSQQEESFHNRTVFDTNIYSQQNVADKNKFGGHCLRCPYQSKSDAERDGKLEPVFSRGEPFTNMELFVHGPQIDPSTGLHVLYGKVIDGFAGISDRRDVQFFLKHTETAVEKHLGNVCKTLVKDITAEINERCLLFHGTSEDDAKLLTQMVQDCWVDKGRKSLFKYMSVVRGRNNKQFTENEKSLVSGGDITYNSTRDELLVNTRGGSHLLPFCCRMPHNKRETKAKNILKLGTSSKMLGLALFSGNCFKTTCRNLTFLPNCCVNFNNVFLAPRILKNITEFIELHFNISTAMIWSVSPKKNSVRSEGEMLVDGVDFDEDFAFDEDLANVEEDEQPIAADRDIASSPVTQNYSAISLLHHGKGLFELLGDIIQTSVRKLFLFNPNPEVTSLCVELYDGSFVLCLSKSRVLVSASLASVLGAAKEWKQIDHDVFVKLSKM